MISKEEKPDWEVLCEECSSAAKEAGLTKEDSKRILEEYRTMERKAIVYDELIDKLEKDITTSEIECRNREMFGEDAHGHIKYKTINNYAREILSILKGEQ